MKNLRFLLFALFIGCFFPLSLVSQTQVAPFVNSHIQLFNAGAPCSGCLLDTFAAGTTTPLTTYSESTGTTPNANPVVLASDGSATVYLTNASYKLRLRTAAGATLWTQDNVSWANIAATVTALTSTGAITLTPSTAATNGANQNSPNLCIDAFYFNVTSLTDSWCWNDVVGTGTNPTSTLTLVHGGSSGALSISVPGSLSAGGTVSAGTQFLANGTLSSPAYAYASEASSGWFLQQAGIQGFSKQGTYLLQVNGTAFTFASTQSLGFSSSAPNSASADVGISRFASGVLGVGTGGQGSVAGTLRAARVGAIRWAENFAGADWVAKVNSADADFAGAAGEIWVSQLAGTSASTALSLSVGRVVRFVQGGTYSTSAALNLGAGQCLAGAGEHSISPGSEVVIKAANSSNIAAVVSVNANNACLENITIDGNKANNPSGGVGIKIADANRFEASNVTVQNSPTHGIWVFSTGTGNLSCCAKFSRMFVFSNNGNGFFGQNTADVFVDTQSEMENNGVDAIVNCATATCTFVSGTVWSNNSASLAGTHALVNGSTLTVASVTSTTMVFTTSTGTLNGVHLYSGAGIELMDSPTWRIRNSDIGGNVAGGILVSASDVGLQSNEEMITNNQFGNNIGPDISIFGFGTVYVSTAHTIVGNLFIGCGGVGNCLANTFPMLAMADDKNSTIIGNTFDNRAGVKKSYGIQMTESSAGRNINTLIGPNNYGNNLGTANINCPTNASIGQCLSDSTKRPFGIGTLMTAAKIVPSAGWGNTATVGSVTGTDTAFRFVITANGTGLAANPTVAITFADGTWTNLPICQVTPYNLGGAFQEWLVSGGASATVLSLTAGVTASFTPSAATTYGAMITCVGSPN